MKKGNKYKAAGLSPDGRIRKLFHVSFTFIQLSLDTSLCHTVNVKTAMSALSAQAIC